MAGSGHAATLNLVPLPAAPALTLEQYRIAQALRAQRLHQARSDLAAFIEVVGRDDHGNALRLAELHKQWIAHVRYCWDRGLKCMILSHFGSGKSSTLAVPLVAFELGRNPNLRAKFITNDDGNASKRTVGVSRYLDSPVYKYLFPDVIQGRKWTEHELYVKRKGYALDPSVHARGILTKGIGGRADLMVFDDVVDQSNVYDVMQRKKVLNFLEATWLSRLEPDGRVLYIGTPWHLDDATHHLMSRQGWCCLIQRVTEDCSEIAVEVMGVIDDGYPGESVSA